MVATVDRPTDRQTNKAPEKGDFRPADQLAEALIDALGKLGIPFNQGEIDKVLGHQPNGRKVV